MRKLATLFVMMLVVASPAAAQGVAPEGLLRAADRRDWHVRVSAGGDVTEGRVRDVDSGRVRIADTWVPLDEITRIERRIRSGGGASGGAIAGGALGGLLFLPLAGLCTGDCDGETAAILLVGVGAGVAIGSMVGGVLIPGEQSWQVEWRSDD